MRFVVLCSVFLLGCSGPRTVEIRTAKEGATAFVTDARDGSPVPVQDGVVQLEPRRGVLEARAYFVELFHPDFGSRRVYIRAKFRRLFLLIPPLTIYGIITGDIWSFDEKLEIDFPEELEQGAR